MKYKKKKKKDLQKAVIAIDQRTGYVEEDIAAIKEHITANKK
jgi:hypothetical protein